MLMTDRPPDRNRDAADDTNVEPGREPTPGTPLWVKAFGLIAIIVVLLIAVIVFTGAGGPHGPQRHAPSGDAGGHTPFEPSTITVSA
jgi:hypothetical protein